MLHMPFKSGLAALLAAVLLLSLLLTGCVETTIEPSSSLPVESSSQSEDESKSESESQPEPTPTEEPVIPIPAISEEDAQTYKDTVAANEDCVAWLNIPGTDINYPVMQADDNDFYWEHDPEGNYLAYGSVYAHFNNNMKSMEELYRNTVLFGHNKYIPAMNKADGTPYDEHMNFSTLMFFQGEKWANDHRYITLTIGEETTYWLIFSALDMETANDQKTFYYWNTCFEENKEEFEGAFTPQWQTNEDWRAILDQALERSYWDYEVDVDETTDKVLMLSTCSYDWGMTNGITNAKLVVMARQLRQEELEQGLKFFDELPALKANEDRRLPANVGERRWISVESGQYKPADYTPDMEKPVQSKA